ncbi:MAG: type II toxin-antitoxin system HicB family antitoxin [bacterium]
MQALEERFTVVIEKDPESGWFIGEVVELPGCYTQAEDILSLQKNISEAISVYLKTMDEGESLPEFVGIQRVGVG